jgi:hypothetical protein
MKPLQSMLSLLLKSPSIPLYERGMTRDSPLWQRGVRGDFVKNFNSIGVIAFYFIRKDGFGRADYIEVFSKNMDWKVVEERLK